MGRQIFYLLVSYAEWERNVIRERTASGKWRRAREGRNPGAVAPYGYRHAGTGRIAPDPAEAPVVRRVFAEAAAQRSARQIAAGLNTEQIPSRHDKGWSAATVARLLRNPAYAGTLAYGRTAPNPRAGAGPRRIRQAPAVAVADALPALVPAGEFDRVQALLSARRPGQMAPRSAAGGGLLSGIAVCGRCGSGLTSHRRRGGSYSYYRCSAAGAKGAGWCDGGFIPQEVAEEAVLKRLHELYRPAAPDPGAHISREQQRVTAAIRETRARLREAGASQARLQQAFLRGRIDVDRLERLAAFQEGEQRRLQVELRRLEAEREAYRRGGRAAPTEEPPTKEPPTKEPPTKATPPLTSAEQKAVLRTLLAGARLYRPRTGTTVILDLVWRTETPVPAAAD